MAMWVWERERKRMLRCNSADRGCVACSGQHHVAGNGADFSPVLALETVYGTDAGSKANDDGTSRWCGCELKAVEVIVHRKKYSFDEPRLPWRVPYEPWLEGDDRSESVPTTYPATARLAQEPRGDGVAASIEAARGKGK